MTSRRARTARGLSCLLLGVSVLTVTGCSSPPASAPASTGSTPIAALRHLPDVAVQPLASGTPLVLGTQRSVVISFWGAWCAPCRRDAPFLDAIARTHRVVGVHYGGEQDAARQAVKEFGLTFPQYFVDPIDLGGYRVAALPMTLFVDATGTVTHITAGGFASAAQATATADRYLG